MSRHISSFCLKIVDLNKYKCHICYDSLKRDTKWILWQIFSLNFWSEP